MNLEQFLLHLQSIKEKYKLKHFKLFANGLYLESPGGMVNCPITCVAKYLMHSYYSVMRPNLAAQDLDLDWGLGLQIVNAVDGKDLTSDLRKILESIILEPTKALVKV